MMTDEAKHESHGEAITIGEALTFIVEATQRHLRAAAIAALAIVVVTAAYIFLAPRKYRSEAQLYVRIGRESVTLDPTATTGETFAISSTRENEINSVVEILTAKDNFRSVVDRLSPDSVLGKAPLPASVAPTPDAPQGTHFVSLEPQPPMSYDHQKAVTALQKQIDIEAVRRANIIDAHCTASSPELAQRLLSEYLEAAIERHMRASRADGSFDFFKAQTHDIAEQYEQAAVELADLKSGIGVASLDERRKTLQAQFSQIESQLSTTEATLSEAIGTAHGLEEMLTNLSPTTVATTTGLPEDALGAAERQRNLLAIREQELLARFTDQHPKVLAVRDQMRRAGDLLDRAEGREQAVRGTNPTFVQIETQLATERAKASGLEQKRTALLAERAKASDRLAELNKNEAQIAGLEERVAVLRRASADYTKKLEQARIDRALELERLSNISISQPATYEPKAVSPQRRIAAVAGLVLAAIAAIGTVLIREWSDRRHPLLQPATA